MAKLQIPKRSLGKTGPAVSAMCLGTMYFGTKVSEDVSFTLLDAYAEAGGAFLDTANKYASWVPGFQGGESEALIGRWMKERKCRDSFFLATKAGLPMPGVDGGLRARQIEAECEKSLQRLGVETIDLYYAHADDRETPLEETLAAFDSLVRAGKVRFLGASNFCAGRLRESLQTCRTHGWMPYSCAQMRHSYLRPDPRIPREFAVQVPASEDMLDLCRDAGLGLLAYSPLLGGSYARVDRPLHSSYMGPDNAVRLRVLRDVAGELGVPPNQVVLAWLMRNPHPAIPVVGASTREQLLENLAAAQLGLDEAIVRRLSDAAEGNRIS